MMRGTRSLCSLPFQNQQPQPDHDRNIGQTPFEGQSTEPLTGPPPNLEGHQKQGGLSRPRGTEGDRKSTQCGIQDPILEPKEDGG